MHNKVASGIGVGEVPAILLSACWVGCAGGVVNSGAVAVCESPLHPPVSIYQALLGHARVGQSGS
jgi:hypothetical protein